MSATPITRFKQRDWLAFGGLVLASLALRIPSRSHFAYHWDSAQYALAIQHYDLRMSQPHAPGYFVFVALGRLLNLFVGDPHASLVWVCVMAGAVLAGLGYLLGTAMFGRGCGLATGAILATSPLCWFQSEIALTNIVDGALVTATVLACWLSLQNKGRWFWLVIIAVLFSAVAGNRQQSGPLLLPACAYAYYRSAPPRWLKILVGALVAGALCLLWFIPTIASSGGLATYLECLAAKRRLGSPLMGWRGGTSLLNSLGLIVGSCWAGLWLAAVLIGGELLQWAWREPRLEKARFLRAHREQLILAGLWVGPFLACGLLIYTLMSGQVLSYFPALAMGAGLAVERLGGRLFRGSNYFAIAAVVVVNMWIFLFSPPWAEGLSPGVSATSQELRDNDRRLSDWFALVRARFKPTDVVICHRGEFYRWSFRHFQYHLPEYSNVLLTHDISLPGTRSEKFWLGQGSNTEFIERFESGRAATVLLVIPPGQHLDLFAPYFDLREAREVDGSGGAFYTLPSTVVRKGHN